MIKKIIGLTTKRIPLPKNRYQVSLEIESQEGPLTGQLRSLHQDKTIKATFDIDASNPDARLTLKITPERDDLRPYQVLSIDAGGIRGIIPALFLAKIEEKTHKPVSELFDLIAGSSAGGMLALGLTTPAAQGDPQYSAQDLYDWSVAHANDIFIPKPEQSFINTRMATACTVMSALSWPLYKQLLPERCLIRRRYIVVGSLLSAGLGVAASHLIKRYIYNPDHLSDSWYTSTGLQASSENLFHNRLMKEALTNVYITGSRVNLSQTLTPCAFTNRTHGEIPMAKIWSVTAACPPFIPPQTIGDQAYIDGAFGAYNPAVRAYTYACQFSKPEDISLISLGTGEYQHETDTPQSFVGDYFWATQAPRLFFQSHNSAIDQDLRALTRESHLGYYHRYQASLNQNIPMGKVSEETLSYLQSHAHDWVAELDETGQIDTLCARLDPDYR